ncbi:hypothetical protein BU17DRAFT_89312 [Hysterangium stoloniferum]|nr:hypothetical protein BU17DRAFT_89312 [Hysterangium stoloniferum]
MSPTISGPILNRLLYVKSLCIVDWPDLTVPVVQHAFPLPRSLLLLAAFNLAHVDATPTPNPWVVVNLRIEGENKTLLDGPVFTRGHNVTTVSGGNHHCDGTNNSTHELPVATCTSALDDAAKIYGFGIDGAFFEPCDDFFINFIHGELATGNNFWKIFINLTATNLGGCQEEVKASDDVLFAFGCVFKRYIYKRVEA